MKPSTPKGTRDFSPEEMVKRNFIFDSIKQVFQLYGYLPIETPAMENLSTLMGKYGEEGDKLIFKILNSGEYLSGIDEKLLNVNNSKVLTNKIAINRLRYFYILLVINCLIYIFYTFRYCKLNKLPSLCYHYLKKLPSLCYNLFKKLPSF